MLRLSRSWLLASLGFIVLGFSRGINSSFGVFYDLTGSYLISFSLSAIGLIISDLCVWIATFAWVAAYDVRLWPASRTRQR